MKKKFYANSHGNKACITINIRQRNFKAKSITKDREEHSIIIKSVSHQGPITGLNLHTTSNMDSKYIKKKLANPPEEESPQSPLDKLSKKKSIRVLNNMIQQIWSNGHIQWLQII